MHYFRLVKQIVSQCVMQKSDCVGFGRPRKSSAPSPFWTPQVVPPLTASRVPCNTHAHTYASIPPHVCLQTNSPHIFQNFVCRHRAWTRSGPQAPRSAGDFGLAPPVSGWGAKKGHFRAQWLSPGTCGRPCRVAWEYVYGYSPDKHDGKQFLGEKKMTENKNAEVK